MRIGTPDSPLNRLGGGAHVRVWRLTKAGQMDVNPTAIVQRAGSFGSVIADGTTLLTRRSEAGLEHYLLSPDSSAADSAMLHLAQAIAARGEEVIDTAAVDELMAGRAIAVMVSERGGRVGRDTQTGADPAEVSRLLASTLSTGQWVAAVLRPKTRWELKRWQAWLAGQMGGGSVPTHHSVASTSIVMGVFAGAGSHAEAASLVRQVAAAIPGFDVPVRARRVTALPLGTAITMSGAVIAACGFAGPLLSLAGLPTLVPFTAGGMVMAAGVSIASGLLPSPARRIRRGAKSGRLPAPGHRVIAPRRPRRERMDKDGLSVQAFDGDYPLTGSGFLVGAHLPATLVAPHGGAASGSQSARSAAHPPVMEQRIGPFIGRVDSGTGLPIHLSAADQWEGTMIWGLPGSGKSRLIQALFTWCGFQRDVSTPVADWPGAQNTLIAFESKGEGADSYEEWARVAGLPVLRLDLSDPATVAVDVLAFGNVSARERARRTVNAMKYSFEVGSVGVESFNTLTQVLTGAFVVTPAIASQVPGVATDASPFYYVNILLGQRGDDLGVALAGAIRSAAVAPTGAGDEDLQAAAEALQGLYSGLTPAQRGQFTKAPRNKIGAFMGAEQWWSRPTRIPWERILQHNGVVIVNTGIARNHEEFDDELKTQMSSMLMYTLYQAIKANCSGWFEAGRGVSVFADELKLLAGTSPEVISWLREQGRSYGVRMFMATQWPEQLHPDVRRSVLSYGTQVMFGQSDPDVASALAHALSLGGDEWTADDLATLPRFEAIVKATVDGRKLSPFTLKMHDFWGTRDRFAAYEGFGSA
ncbi:ATP-binding protein [Agromyces subbeticus]|uniref:ATP-binding protein n=1 Tax=Agromyces subbeticus TaxID=293890 RepID=UPI0003B314C2|nr:ATP-binding protein [Agromyces subbeticus]